ncbi:hypothetical protein AC1031_011372 [Aphanomyces cochlioides]|nr:hypothetical protein AC1031_011372 [Aphanomyces cochlioides]
MKKIKPSMVSLLPFDVMAKIVFFIREWNVVLTCLEALRPANGLGPLESLLRLHLLNWKECDLWPTLDLTKLNEASRVDVETIAKFYSKVTVNVKTNADWARQYIHPNASVEMKDVHILDGDDDVIMELEDIEDGSSYDLDTETLAKWKDIRVVAIDEKIFTMPSCLVYFPRLVVIDCQECIRQMAEAMFDYAASSSSLRILRLEAYESYNHGHCSITSAMAKNLIQWIKSQPIESISIKFVIWEVFSQRNAVVSSALAKLSMKKLEIVEEYASGWYSRGDFCRAEQALLLEFRDPRNCGFENLAMLIEYIHSFEPIFDSDIKTLCLIGFHSVGFSDLWPLFGPLLQRFKLEQLTVYIDGITEADAAKVVETLQNASTLETLFIVNPGKEIPFDAVQTFLHGVPPSVKRFPKVSRLHYLAYSYSQEECKVLQDLTSKNGISLLY